MHLPTSLLRQLHLLSLIAIALLGQPAATLSASAQEIGAGFFTLPCPPLDAKNNKDYGAGRSDPFQREMVRQAILLSAREEFGLITRDPVLGESLPDGVDGLQVGYELRLTRQKPIEVWITGPDKKLGPYVIEKTQAGKIDGYVPMSWHCETFSKQAVVEALTELGFEHKPTPIAGRAPIPQSMRDRLYDMDLVTQFYLARELHALIREEGENAQRLAALSHAYSNLGQLTRYRLDYSNRAFHARALLYATRAARLEPEHPEGKWAIGYAWYMFDLPGFGNGPLNQADKMNQALADPVERPAWMELRPLYWRYNYMALIAYSKESPGPLAELAAILAVSAAETSDVDAVYRAVIDNCNEVNPDTQRGYDACFASSHWWLMSNVYPTARADRFYEAIPRLLRDHKRHIPRDVFNVSMRQDPSIGEKYLDIAEIAWALEDSGSNNEAIELSHAALAHQFEEMLVASAIDQYGEPSVNKLGRDTSRHLFEPIIQSLQRHQYAKLFEQLRMSFMKSRQEGAAITRQVELGDVNMPLIMRLEPGFPQGNPFANMQGDAAWKHIYYQATQNAHGLHALAKLYNNRGSYRAFASWLHAGASHCPFRAITYIRNDNVNEQKLTKRVEFAKHMIGVQLAAAEWYIERDREEEAFDRLMDVYITLPDKEIAAQTAEYALRVGKEDFWRELMIDVSNASPKIRPYGGSELTIAATYMEGQKWEEALYWAQIAYEKRSWDKETMYLAWCLVKNDRADEAVQCLKKRDVFAGNDLSLRFCYMLGLTEMLADFTADYVRDQLPREVRRDPRMAYSHKTHALIVAGQSKEALAPLYESWSKFKITNDAMRVAILGQQHGDTDRRDEMLVALKSSEGRDYRAAIAAKVAQTLLETPDTLPTDEEIRTVTSTSSQWSEYAYAQLNFAWYLIVSGDKERGQQLLIKTIDDKYLPLNSYERYMAAIVLRQSGYDMDAHPWRFPEAHDWPR